MRTLWKPLLVIVLALAVPIVPFVVAGAWFEEALSGLVRAVERREVVFAAVVGVLAVDIFLPVPSSGVGTLAGARLGTGLGTAAVWLGTTLGAVVGFALARRWGRRLAERLAGRKELERIEIPANRLGAGLLLVTRPLPILAEAAVLLLGATRLPWRAFWWPVAAGNLVISACYATLGEFAQRHDWLAAAVAVSLAAPLLLVWLVRNFGPFSR